MLVVSFRSDRGFRDREVLVKHLGVVELRVGEGG